MPTTHARELAAQLYCDPRVSDRVLDPDLCEVIAERFDEYRGALQWCSASQDFHEGGQARIGFEKIVRPLIS
jgi:hypothetical protein